jgi:cell division septation protein DedD
MDEQVSWKGQSFTLLVFGGIVFLCSIFFVLGMLVGRGQGEKAAEAAVVAEAAKTDSEDRKPDSKPVPSPYSGIATGSPAIKDSIKESEPEKPKPAPKEAAVPPPPAPPPPAPKATPAKEKAPVPAKMYYLQVTALEKEAAAKKQVDELRKAGFPAVVVEGDGARSLYKVQVGPFATTAEADTAKRKLEGLGFKPIRK